MDEREELERLRELVGPSEDTYTALRADRDEARRVARDAFAEVGELRGRIVEMGVQLSRARQDQEVLLRRAELSGVRRLLDRVARRWSVSVVPRLRRAGRSRPTPGAEPHQP